MRGGSVLLEDLSLDALFAKRHRNKNALEVFYAMKISAFSKFPLVITPLSLCFVKWYFFSLWHVFSNQGIFI